jgi:hypothetical protein
MREHKNWGKIGGLTLHVLIGALLILTGSQKIFGFVPPSALGKYGLGEYVRLIGAGAIVTAILLVIPRTRSLGTLLTSAFWGGAICIHMAHGELYIFQAAMLVLTWVGAYLRNPATPSILSTAAGTRQPPKAESPTANARFAGMASSPQGNEIACEWVI